MQTEIAGKKYFLWGENNRSKLSRFRSKFIQSASVNMNEAAIKPWSSLDRLQMRKSALLLSPRRILPQLCFSGDLRRVRSYSSKSTVVKLAIAPASSHDDSAAAATSDIRSAAG